MSNTELIIEERSRDIGDFLVGRLIPFRKKRMVGPFIFIDHMGPSEVTEGKYLDIGQHPHIGLSTLTYLLEGEVHHRDSMGTDQIIGPGSVNLMTAGRGVTHTERTPTHLRGKTSTLHGFQIWIALPKAKEEMEPEFFHVDAKDLPSWKDKGANFTLVAGTGYGKESPVPTYSEQFMLEIKTDEEYELDVAGNLKGEIGICIVEGSIQACENYVEKGNMLVSKLENQCAIKVAPNTHLLIFGGKPFEEERFIFWNFVATSKEKLEESKIRWKEKRFPKVADDNSYIPLP
ncbi:pirin family protein [Chondrinema litorale]|uniref:pirin family protein n=1 Tax=Chondrinema litorale TaxID=2994555 RepID=UPI00254273C5|nr:pirin family protein [Chondrinema litorale]UZR97961.1 pirin family protein [Chondrinema litorale]